MLAIAPCPRLLGEGSYFSEESMRERNPLLFQEAVGKVIEERPPTCLSEAILHRYAEDRLAQRVQEAERHREMTTPEEEEEEEEEETEEERGDRDGIEGHGRGEGCARDVDQGGGVTGDGDETADMCPEERAALTADFRRLMQERFLDGKDEDADYKTIDNDEALDADWIALEGQDAEDSYFDQD
eukprot:jgi/Mesvir1/3948/Mv22708-RA.1